MGFFGHCGWVSGGGSTTTMGKNRVRALKCVLSEAGLVDEVYAALGTSGFPPPGDASNYKCSIYDESGGYPNALQGVSNIQSQGAGQAAQLVTFTFSPALNLPAGNYYISIHKDGGNGYLKTDGIGVLRTTAYDGGADYYTTPPATFPGGAATDTINPWICAHYDLVANPYPTAYLKKGFISAYHCFMSAYIRAKVESFDPLKLPDGTLF